MNTTMTATGALALIASLANAGNYTTYTDRNTFNAGSGALTIETFESETIGDIALPTVLDSGLGVAMTSGSVSSYIDAGDTFGYGFENTTFEGRKYLAFGRNITVPGAPDMPETGSYTVEYSFAESVNAFGFDLSGPEFIFAANGFNVTTFSNGQLTDDFFFPTDQFFSVQFYGMVTELDFDAVRINIPVLGSNGTADYVAFDDVTWGVPTPSALSMLALGGLISTRRRR
jgi:hypothetical protein